MDRECRRSMREVNDEVLAFLRGGRLTRLPAKRKKRLAALVWLAAHIPSEKQYTEPEFNELLYELHTFDDPAGLRRELCEVDLVNRSPDGAVYRLNPAGPSWEELLAKYCGETAQPDLTEGERLTQRDGKTPRPAPTEEELHNPYVKPAVVYSEKDLADAADFRNGIHTKALEIVQRVRPEAKEVVDRYPVEAYFQQLWDYPGTWYTIVAIPESARSREALINTIVSDTLAQYR